MPKYTAQIWPSNLKNRPVFIQGLVTVQLKDRPLCTPSESLSTMTAHFTVDPVIMILNNIPSKKLNKISELKRHHSCTSKLSSIHTIVCPIASPAWKGLNQELKVTLAISMSMTVIKYDGDKLDQEQMSPKYKSCRQHWNRHNDPVRGRWSPGDPWLGIFQDAFWNTFRLEIWF